MSELHRPPRRDRGSRAAQRADAGARGRVVGNGAEPCRRAGDSDQALGALLQVDRLRRHRGQEAHRPVGRADDPRVRGRPARLQRRRRRQGDRRSTVRTRRRRSRSSTTARRGSRRRVDTIPVPAVAPRPRVRALHDGGAPLRLRGRARDRRVGAAAPRGARVHRARARGGSRSVDDPLDAVAGELEPYAAQFFDGLRNGSYDGSLEAGTAVRLASVLRYATGVRAARRVPGRVRQGRDAEHGGRGPHRRAHEGDRGAHPARSTRSSTRPRPSPSGSRAPTRRCCTCRSCRRCSPRARRATASRTGRCARWSRSTPRSTRSSGWTRYSIAGDTIHVIDRGGIARDIPSRTDTSPVLRGTKHRAATEREVTVARGADGRTLILVPEVKGNQTTGHHAAARALPRSLGRRRRAPRARGLPRPLPARSPTRSPRPNR